MKKMVFSAVALVAFSFAGIASTGEKKLELKEVKFTKLESTENLQQTVIKAFPCWEEYMMVFFELVDTFGEDEAHENAMAYYSNCLGN